MELKYRLFVLEQAEFTLFFILSKTREVIAPYNALAYDFL